VIPAPEQAARKRAPCETEQHGQSVSGLLRLPRVGRLVLVAALIQGGHAMQVGFAVLRCTAAGIGPATAGLLWPERLKREMLFKWQRN
jgi:PPP family 3-phenylpropionic acid transporter